MEVAAHHLLNDLAGTRRLIKMSLSVNHSVVKSCEFNRKKVQSVHVNGEDCLVSRGVYMAIGLNEENGKKSIENFVPKEYKLRFGGVNPSLNQWEDTFLLHKYTPC